MYQSLQGGRAAAAALVVLFHLGGTFAQDKYFGFKALDGPFAWADAGVEFFFVLSGFLITVTHRKDFGRPVTVGRYAFKRGLRIYPTYWLICIAVCLSALAVPSLRQSIPTDPLILAKAFALLPQDPAVVGGTGAPILFVAWSMQYELLFYAVIAFFIVSRALGFLAVGGLALAHLYCQFGTGSSCAYPLSFLSSNLILLFAMGVGAAYMARSRLKLPYPKAVAAVSVLAFVAFGAFEVWVGRDSIAVDRRLIYGALSFLIIIALAQAEDAGKLVLKQRWIGLLGDSSYALYLLHIPLISLMCKLFVHMGVSGPVAIIATFIGIFLTCVAAAAAFYLTIERRLLAMLRAKWLKPSKKPPALDAPPAGVSTTLHPMQSASSLGRDRPSAHESVRWQ